MIIFLLLLAAVVAFAVVVVITETSARIQAVGLCLIALAMALGASPVQVP